MTTHKSTTQVQFTQKQLDYLESLYPTLVHSYKTPVEQLREYFGQQQVLESVRKRVQRHVM